MEFVGSLLWLSLLLIFHAYIGYPASLMVMKAMKGRRPSLFRPDFFSRVSLIITAYNEEKRIKEKILNTLALDYPKEKLQILVASDGSSDKTNDIVKSHRDDGVELIPLAQRNGKENAQKEALGYATGEIIVFTDVATLLDSEGITEIVSNFSDPSVGCVTSEDKLLSQDGGPSGEGAYVRYEMWLRRLESDVNSVVGLSGSFFAVRKEVCRNFSGDLQSDFGMLFSAVKMGYRGVSDSSAEGHYLDIAKGDQEFNRKVRTVVRGLTVFFEHTSLLNPFKHGFFSYQLFCHKLLRWLVPFLLVACFVTSTVLAVSSFFFLGILICQIIFYGIAGIEHVRKKPFLNALLRVPGYFVAVNSAIAVAWKQYLTGHRIVMWTPSER